jgi:hypothetical protein
MTKHLSMFGAGLLLVAAACGGDDDAPAVDAGAGGSPDAPPGEVGPPDFEDMTDSIDFDHASLSFDGDGLGGVAWLEYDDDGDLDLLIANGRDHDNGLFRNDDGVFTDVAAAAGIDNGVGNNGIAVADIDNDGYPDVFMTGEGGLGLPGAQAHSQTPTRLYHNNGDGTFDDITATAGIPGPPTAFSPAFGDIDGDGYVDLYIAAPGSLSLQVQHGSQLYLNDGDLTFTDISAGSGIEPPVGACAATFTHYDDDGLIDLLVANCNEVGFAPTPLQMFQNDGDNTFTDVSAAAGIATLGGYWMGAAVGDYDTDGDLDVFSTNFGLTLNAPHVLLQNNGDGTYTDRAGPAGVDNWEFAWGAVLADFDNDSDLDLYFAGALPAQPFAMIGDQRAAPGRLFENLGDGTFGAPTIPRDLGWDAASGVAHGDYNGDGFPDLAILVTEIPEGFTTAAARPGDPVLLEAKPNRYGWLTVALEGTTSNRMAIGAQIEATAGDLTQIREVHSGSSYSSQNSPWPTFGLAEADSVSIVVHWPSGLSESFGEFEPGQKISLTEGDGSAL